MRAWYQKDMTTGLLYICSLGEARHGIPAPHNTTWAVPSCIRAGVSACLVPVVCARMMLMAVTGRAGEVRPDCPVALIENKSDGETDTMKVIPCEHQLPQQREQVTRLWPHDLCSCTVHLSQASAAPAARAADSALA